MDKNVVEINKKLDEIIKLLEPMSAAIFAFSLMYGKVNKVKIKWDKEGHGFPYVEE